IHWLGTEKNVFKWCFRFNNNDRCACCIQASNQQNNDNPQNGEPPKQNWEKEITVKRGLVIHNESIFIEIYTKSAYHQEERIPHNEAQPDPLPHLYYPIYRKFCSFKHNTNRH